MHQLAQTSFGRPATGRGPVAADGRDLSIGMLTRAVRLHWPVIAAAVVACCLIGMVYLLFTQPLFTAKAALLVESRDTPVTLQPTTSVTQLDPAGVESQVEVLRSERVANAVINNFKLDSDPEFIGPGGLRSMLPDAVQDWMGAEETPDPNELRREVVAGFFDRLSVKRVGLTYVIEVSFSSSSPAKAATIANGIVQAYFALVLEAKNDSAKRTGEWLRQSIEQARTDASEAANAAQDFRVRYGLVQTGKGLFVEQQLSDANVQLVLANAAVAEAEAKLNRVLEVQGKNEISTALVSDVLRSDVFNRLRLQYIDMRARQADLEARFGKEHSASASIGGQVAEVERSMRAEMSRIAEGLKSDHDIAIRRLESTQKYVDDLIARAVETSKSQARLQELESAALRNKTIYENLLVRFSENSQQQLAPGNIAHVITPASEPLYRSHPKKSVILGMAMIAGLLIGIALTLARELIVRGLRGETEVLEALGKRCLGITPAIPVGGGPGVSHVRGDSGGSRSLVSFSKVARYTQEHPFSRFTEAVRAANVAIRVGDNGRPIQIVGVTAALFDEGATTISLSLAYMAARMNVRTLLIDANVRRPTLTKALPFDQRHGGLGSVLSGQQDLASAVWRDPQVPLHILPAFTPRVELDLGPDMLSSSAFSELLLIARDHYDYVILDLPPLAPYSDVAATASSVGALILVAEWEKTPTKVIEELLGTNPDVEEKVFGLILNKANLTQLERLQGRGGATFTGSGLQAAVLALLKRR